MKKSPQITTMDVIDRFNHRGNVHCTQLRDIFSVAKTSPFEAYISVKCILIRNM